MHSVDARGTAPVDDPGRVRERLREALLETYFRSYEPTFLTTPDGLADIDSHVFGRYETCVDLVLPWVGRVSDVDGADVVEIGCGTGSSTASFAARAARVSGYDIDAASLEGAQARMDVLGLTNVDLHLVDPATALEAIAARHPPGSADVVLLYAVLEHQTLEERLECIDMSWNLLHEGGVLVVVESPNRLALWDYHTSLLPFFHQLPDALALRYLDRSPRDAFTSSMRQALAESEAAGSLALARWGRGVGSHEFELVLGELDELVVADGYEDEIVAWFPIETEDRLLDAFFVEKGIATPRAFTRHVLNFILRKGGRRAGDPPLLRDRSESVLDTTDPSYAALDARCRALEASYAALEASPAVRLARQLDRTPRLRRIAGSMFRAVARLRRA